MRKYYFSTMACLLALSLTACINPERPEPSTTTDSENRKTETSTESNIETSQTETEPISETETQTEPESESTQSSMRSVPLGEEFTISLYETVTLDQESEDTYQLTLSSIMYNEENEYKSINFDCIDHGEYGYPGFSSDRNEPYIYYSNFYGNYKITLLSDTKENAVIRIDKRILKEPVTLSGNPEETFTTTDYEYTETENCFIYFDKDITIPADTAVLIDDIYKKVEQYTKMEYMPENCFYQETSSLITYTYFNSNPWEGINPDYKKINIYLIDDKENLLWGSCSDNLNIVLILQELMYNGKIQSYIPAHEITHSFISKNFGMINPIFNEGMAVKIGSEIEKEYPNLASEDIVYSGQDKANRGVTAANAEEIFLTKNEYDDDETPYEYGSDMIEFISEKYGADSILKYRDQFQQMKDPDEKYQVVTPEFESEVLKKQYGDNFFIDFGNWYTQKHKNDPMVVKE